MSEADMTGDARSPAGHAAFSMRGTDDRWVLIQVNTFTNWVNEQLRQIDKEIEDLQTDFCDGIKLCGLMEVLQNKRIGRVVKKPINQHQYLENVTIALRAMVNDNIKLVNIGSEDIVNGNMKLILGMVWKLILRYQIGKASKVPPKKLMLSWLNAVIPECNISNFNTDWNNGIALHALIEYCKPGTCPNWRQLRHGDALRNCKAGMELAKKHFDIPMVVSPENFASPDLDELSGMTYLSYFMKVDSPGYHATLGWVRKQIPHTRVNNFQTDWNDGSVLTHLVHELGGNKPGFPNIDRNDWAGNISKAMNVAESTLGVNPVISAREMADPEVDHLGVMAYAAWFQHLNPGRGMQPAAPAPAPPPVVAAPPPPRIPPSRMLQIIPHQRESKPNNVVTFALDILDDEVRKSAVRVEVVGPTSKPEVTLNWQGDSGVGQFIPLEPGNHKIIVYNEEEVIEGCPLDMMVKSDGGSVRLDSPLPNTTPIRQAVPIKISAAQYESGNVKVEACSPSSHIQELSVVEANGVYTANFTPTEVGDWQISILYERKHIQGSPFNVRVYDAERVKIFGLEGGAVGKTFSFSADCSGAGDGQLTVDINHNGRSVPVQVHPDGHGLYRVSFTPEGPGIYTIRVYFAGMEVKDSPYSLEIVDSSMISAVGDGLQSVEVNRRAVFLVNTHGAAGGDVRVNITSPRGASVPAQVFNNGDGTYKVEYVPSDVGEYMVDVFYYGKPISGSPFRVNAFDWNRITVHNLRNTGGVGKLIEFDIDAMHAGSGNLEIMVNDGTIPCSVQNRGNRKFHASFMPKEPIPHLVQMRFNGREVPGSPWRVDVRGAAHLTASGPGLTRAAVRRPVSFEVRASGGSPDGTLTCTITGPRRPVPCQVINNYNGTYRVEYTPTEAGNHKIDLVYEGMAVPGSPYQTKVYDTAAIRLSDISSAVVGKPVEFTIDVSQAGEGELEIMVNRGAVPNTVKMIRKGEFLVSFVPMDPRPHQIDIRFNQETLPRCPITVPVLDASRVTVQGEGIQRVAVNKSSYFRVNTQAAGDADLAVRVTSPTNRTVPARVTGSGATGFDVELSLTEVGSHRVDIEYAGLPVPNSPFFVKAFDPNRVIVQGVEDGIVGKRSAFRVDVNEAGEGNMEISIMARGRNIQNNVRQIAPGKFEVSYTPLEGIEHQASVTFNGTHVPGSPYPFKVTDASRITAGGDGLSVVPCGRPTTFNIQAPGSRPQDLEVRIIGPFGRDVPSQLREQGSGNFVVEWTPPDVGDYKIEVKYHGLAIPNSPFTARAWDAQRVRVSNTGPGRVSKPYNFNIDAMNAGAGNLEIIVSVGNENVPNFIKSEGNARFDVSFTPRVPDTHIISVKFNGEVVPGSPFYCNIVDGSKATASGEGLRRVAVGKSGNFTVNTNGIGDAELDIEMLSPSGRPVPVRTSGNPSSGFNVQFVPTEVGRHTCNIKYADMPIQGSPFKPEVYDASMVRVGNIPDGVLGKPVQFDVDCTMAGEGTLTVDIRGRTTSAQPEINQKGNSRFNIAFIPRENCPHNIVITFNGEPVPGSPFTCKLFDASNVTATWQQIRSVPVGRQATFEVDPAGAPNASVEVEIKDPYGRMVPSSIRRIGSRYSIDFTPTEVGGHFVSVTYADQQVLGSPYTCYCYDVNRVRITDITSNGKINSEMGFTVDTSESGQGDIDVEIMGPGQATRTQRQRLDDNRHRFTFLATSATQYMANITFNLLPVPNTPLIFHVADPFSQLSLSQQSQDVAVVEQLAYALIHTQGAAIDMNDVLIHVKAPNGDLVPAKIVQQPDGDYKVEYSSKYTGRHTVEILYAGQAIMGSPFYVEIYDPNKIRVQGLSSGTVGETMAFDIIRNEAGKAELQLTITSPSNRNVPYNISSTHKGEHVSYVPVEPGPHSIYITYGGLEVPGCPLTQNIADAGTVNAYGDGLLRADENKPAQFYVETGGKRGDLFVQVDGPNSIAKCNIEPDGPGRYLVTYTPVEVGVYDVQIKWNGREIPGSPFHPRVSDTRKVRLVGGYQGLVDANNQMSLNVNEVRRVEFDCTDAGPGKLTAEARGPMGIVPVELETRGDGRYVLSFVPRSEGEHTLSVYWNDVAVSRSPFYGYAKGARAAINHEKVILTGRGLQEARIKEDAEFVIDGTEAGPGTPEVKLSGVKADIDVKVQPLGGNKYKCTYYPVLPGAYLLDIMWSDRRVRGSPFKVNVTAPSDASKVVCTGEGLKVGIIGKEIKSVIDTRRAGPGELTAHCMGPHKVAYCELYDHHDGTFTLNVRPQESGRHILQVKYEGEHVPGSPFVLRVSGAPDASKVRVTGPGIEHGILAMYQSRFIVETRGAGAGQLTVRIRGPKGAFRVEMQRESQKDRTILCRYDPTEVGDYIIHIKWSGEHVPGSPFHVQIFDTQEELDRFMRDAPGRLHSTNTLISNRSWQNDTYNDGGAMTFN